MKNYASEKSKINKYYDKKIKDVIKAERILDNRGMWINNPTEKDRMKKIREIEKERLQELSRLEVVNDALDLDYIKIKVEWKKSNTWGYNPKCDAWTSGYHYDTGSASGCGYDKESAAVEKALRNSDSLQKFIIHNLSKLKDEYGIETRFGLTHLSIAGKGVSTLLNIFRKLSGWEITEMHGETFDGYEIRKRKWTRKIK